MRRGAVCDRLGSRGAGYCRAFWSCSSSPPSTRSSASLGRARRGHRQRTTIPWGAEETAEARGGSSVPAKMPRTVLKQKQAGRTSAPPGWVGPPFCSLLTAILLLLLRRVRLPRRPGRPGRPDATSSPFSKREVEYWIPRLHSPVNSRRFPDISEISVRTKQTSCRYLWKTVFFRLLP